MSPHSLNAIIAGASGLVGTELLHQLLDHPRFNHIYALARRPLPFHSKKLHQIIDSQLRIIAWEDDQPIPEYGFICLGTTQKIAGSQQALAAIDIDLVKSVAITMKNLGVKHLIVVSSLGASKYSPAHYLRCKGKMEQALTALAFEHCIFVRPGPLKGERNKPRKDELAIQRIFDAIHPLMIGPLQHFIPIPAEDVATSMLKLAMTCDKHQLRPTTVISGHHLRSM
ncbi:nucleoside-diphosphate sugar epimerase [Photobacterium iliopiscarium]|uniref:Nucleoside-diphosphate sugar epimerase n=1 Tax=Photobacterium iliopiscarium TaxID=56192 RepID=A0A0D8Q5A6_9GAMM|nr:NAD-dependent epimerase/dehydratase family protein [Photobacterium iliopiscarium]KJG26045.1 nucleoside-diphosphate sugar epimerase [Photobacterium iliopiscarium]PST93156.1 nucleoside-diphosphate sugar epimerase [Photobacterium iliopiscarium]PSV98651.1 nucleoside-diphosphate sugar epimerase [Photobacterium iliopiscarium]PSW98020.1 nucleoside-diphosphate sugar epimerase [Photobacterium iliopiscarium]